MPRVLAGGAVQLIGVTLGTWAAWRVAKAPGVALVAGAALYRIGEDLVTSAGPGKSVVLPMGEVPVPPGAVRV